MQKEQDAILVIKSGASAQTLGYTLIGVTQNSVSCVNKSEMKF